MHTWLDRPLSLAGRVIIKNEEGKLEKKLWRHTEPICQIPNLAIHLQSERGQFTWDTDETFRPIFATTLIDDLLVTKPEEVKNQEPPPLKGVAALRHLRTPMDKKHMYTLLKLIADELQTTVENIMDFDLCFYDVTPP